jgi:hypothetical protein
MLTEKMTYTDSDGVDREIRGGLSIRADKSGKLWLWSDTLGYNLAYKQKDAEHLLKMALNSLLFTLERQKEELRELRELREKLFGFIETVTPTEEEHNDTQ